LVCILQINKLMEMDQLLKRMSGTIQIYKINSFKLLKVWIHFCLIQTKDMLV
jgi:hypothetical protein